MAVIIGRAGSKGLPGKNSRKIAGRPMICHTIQHALDAQCVDQVVVSTDGPEIAAAARSMNVEVIDRPAELADDHAPIDAAVRHAVDSTLGRSSVLVIILYANVPVRPPNLIDRAVHMLLETGADSVQSYCDVGKHHPYWMVALDDSQRVRPHHRNPVYRRQDLPKLLIPDGGVIAVTHESLFRAGGADGGPPDAFLGADRRGIELPAGAVVDVDGELDFAVAETLLRGGRQVAGSA